MDSCLSENGLVSVHGSSRVDGGVAPDGVIEQTHYTSFVNFTKAQVIEFNVREQTKSNV